MAVKLNPKQRVFVGEYLCDLNATQAAIRSGYSPKTANRIGAENLTKPVIQSAIQAAMAKREKRTEITQDRVLQEYARIAFFDIGKLVDDKGRPLALKDMDDDTRRAIVSIDVVSSGGGEGSAPGEVVKFKLADKKAALDSCARHLGMFEKDNKQPGEGSGLAEFLAQLCSNNKRMTLPSEDYENKK
jgi:phage terminase small subunit